MCDHGVETPNEHSSPTRRRVLQLGALSVGGLLLGATAAAASDPAIAGPGQDGRTPTDPKVRNGDMSPMTTTAPAGTTSYNGWPIGNPSSVIGVQNYTVAGTNIVLPVKSGDVAWVLMTVANRFNAEVQALIAGQNWGYDYRADVNSTNWWSCHASGTAIDLNAVLHPNGSAGTFTAAQVLKIRKILADCNGVVAWGADFRTPDEMHYEINVPPGDPSLAALAAQFRGGTVAPPPPVPPTRVITLRAGINGRYVTAEQRGAAALIANRTVIGSWEQFDVIAVGTTQVAFRAHANNRFVCADRAGAAPLIANRTAVGLWETFTIVPQLDGTVALRAAANGRYVTAEHAGVLPLIANRAAVGPWEKFTIIGT